MAQSKIINNSGSGNYVSDNKVFILDDFSSKSCSELIGNLTDMVFSLPQNTIYQANTQIISPYDISDNKHPIIDVFINSNGGDGNILDSIVALLSIAKLNGAIIRTTVLGKAYSCGSLLAITGTPGYRIMYSHAKHHIHFGRHAFGVTKESEIDMAANNLKQETAAKQQMYLDHTKLKAKDLKKIQSNEQGYLNAEKCLEHGLCDWILTTDGIFINKNTKQR